MKNERTKQCLDELEGDPMNGIVWMLRWMLMMNDSAEKCWDERELNEERKWMN